MYVRSSASVSELVFEVCAGTGRAACCCCDCRMAFLSSGSRISSSHITIAVKRYRIFFIAFLPSCASRSVPATVDFVLRCHIAPSCRYHNLPLLALLIRDDQRLAIRPNNLNLQFVIFAVASGDLGSESKRVLAAKDRRNAAENTGQFALKPREISNSAGLIRKSVQLILVLEIAEAVAIVQVLRFSQADAENCYVCPAKPVKHVVQCVRAERIGASAQDEHRFAPFNPLEAIQCIEERIEKIRFAKVRITQRVQRVAHFRFVAREVGANGRL